MARIELPFEYTPAPVPEVRPGELAEEYVVRLNPYLRDEFDAIRRQVQLLPVVPYAFDPPRAPFNGMLRLFGENSSWVPGNAGFGLYVYWNQAWHKAALTGPYPHE